MSQTYSPFKQVRKFLRLTQNEFAREIDVSQSAVSKWEANEGFPTLNTLQKILDRFPQINPLYLMGQSSAMTHNNAQENKLILERLQWEEEQKNTEHEATVPEGLILREELEEAIQQLIRSGNKKKDAELVNDTLLMQNRFLKYELNEKNAQIAYLKTIVDLQAQQLEEWKQLKQQQKVGVTDQ